MTETDVRALVDDYLAAFSARDLPRCLDLFGDDAVLFFPPATYRGKQALEDWHKARFQANAQLIGIDNMAVDGDTVTIHGSMTSNRLKAWRIRKLAGRAIFKVRNGKFADVRFDLQAWNALIGRGAPTEAFRADS